MNDQPSKHHFLITGEIVFQAPGSEQVNAMRCNAILVSDQTTINVTALGKSQQVLQLNFFKKMGDPKLQVLDVIITNICPLGQMTEAEFHQAPEGMQLQEQASKEPESAANDLPLTGDALDEALKSAAPTTEQ